MYHVDIPDDSTAPPEKNLGTESVLSPGATNFITPTHSSIEDNNSNSYQSAEESAISAATSALHLLNTETILTSETAYKSASSDHFVLRPPTEEFGKNLKSTTDGFPGQFVTHPPTLLLQNDIEKTADDVIQYIEEERSTSGTERPKDEFKKCPECQLSYHPKSIRRHIRSILILT